MPLPSAAKRRIGERMRREYGRWPVYSKFFDNMGPIPLHMHQGPEYAAKVGCEGKPEGVLFPAPAEPAAQRLPHLLRAEPDTCN